MYKLSIAFIVLTVSTFSAEARTHHRHHYRHHVKQEACVPSGFFMQPCTSQTQFNKPVREDPPKYRYASAQIVSHPSGCPRIAFCGCGASVRVFGHSVRNLWLARNWLKFPRTSPAPGMVAARSGHVFVLESQASSGSWVVYDANSGGHQTRIHERSLAGYAIVNPHAG
jgi:hypothetical protein